MKLFKSGTTWRVVSVLVRQLPDVNRHRKIGKCGRIQNPTYDYLDSRLRGNGNLSFCALEIAVAGSLFHQAADYLIGDRETLFSQFHPVAFGVD
jgi:hypothetical protein